MDNLYSTQIQRLWIWVRVVGNLNCFSSDDFASAGATAGGGLTVAEITSPDHLRTSVSDWTGNGQPRSRPAASAAPIRLLVDSPFCWGARMKNVRYAGTACCVVLVRLQPASDPVVLIPEQRAGVDGVHAARSIVGRWTHALGGNPGRFGGAVCRRMLHQIDSTSLVSMLFHISG